MQGKPGKPEQAKPAWSTRRGRRANRYTGPPQVEVHLAPFRQTPALVEDDCCQPPAGCGAVPETQGHLSDEPCFLGSLVRQVLQVVNPAAHQGRPGHFVFQGGIAGERFPFSWPWIGPKNPRKN